MTANYHTHSYLCRHAAGTPREYVETAIKNGLRILGFSDHVPYPPHYSGYRMAVSETVQYVAEIRKLQVEYADKIQILLGYEAEYYPAHFKEMLRNLEQYGYDYLILGQHYTNNEYDGVYSGSPCGEETLKQYVDQVTEALETGKFLYVAHPDIINYRSDKKIYKREITRLCETALKLDIPLEFNLLGFEERRHYPYDTFWEIVAETGAKAVIGCDAHKPDSVAEPRIYADAVRYLDKFGIKPLEKTEIKKDGLQ